MTHRLHIAMVLSRVALAQIRDWWREVRHWERIRD